MKQAVSAHWDPNTQLKKRVSELLSQDEVTLHQEKIVKAAQLADMLFYIGLGVLGRNLHVLGKLLLAREAPDCQAAQSRRQRSA